MLKPNIPKLNLRERVLDVYALLDEKVSQDLIESYEVVDAYLDTGVAIIHTRLIRVEYGKRFRIDYIFNLNDEKPVLEFLTPLSDFDDLKSLRLMVEYLWTLLDDIVTTGDIAKGDLEWRIAEIDRIQALRFDGFKSDGHNLYVRQNLVDLNEQN